jgi:predicted transcriptional regulator YdeE
MEKYYLQDGIKLLCVKAKSFPDGIKESFEKLEKLLPSREGRDFYGISYPDKGNLIYFAAVKEAYEGETEKLGCQTFTIPRGTYTSIYLTNFMKDVKSVGVAFKKLLDNPAIDPNGCCVEMYINDNDVRCMVRLDPGKIIDKDTELELNTSLKEFQELFSSLNEKYLNTVPVQGGWTVGQLARHVIKVNSGFLKQLNGPVKETKRKYDEMAENIKISFLDFNIKMKSPDFVVPEIIDYKKEDLSLSLEEIKSGLIQSAKSLDMTKTCMAFELPVLGNVTRFEAIYFIIYHTKRHIHQLKNIIKSFESK